MEINNPGFSTPDIIIGIFILIFCILGFAKGVIRQFFSILAFIIASAASIVVPYFVNLPDISGASPIWGYIILSILIWIPSYLIFNSVGKFVAKRMTKKGITFSDRLWGFLFGAFKGLIIVIAIIFLIDFLPNGVKQSIPLVSSTFVESKIVSTIQPYNPLLKIHVMQNLQIIISALSDPDYMDLLSKDPEFQKLCNQQTIRELLNDPELRKIIEERQFIKFIAHPRVQMLIKDQEALKLLLTTDIDKVVIKSI